MITGPDVFRPIDLARERDEDVTTSLRPRRRFPWGYLATGIAACFGAGLALGYGLAASRTQPDAGPSLPAVTAPASGAPARDIAPAALPSAAELAQTERLIEARLARIAFQEANNAIGQSLRGSSQVLQAIAATPQGEEMPVRIEATPGPVSVRVDGREVEPVARDVYRIRRSEPVQVEFVPVPPGFNRTQYFELVVTPLLQLEQYDPYAPPRRHGRGGER
jgi:hypothetical protein